MKLIVLPRHKAQRFNPGVPYGIISITDPGGEVVSFPARKKERVIIRASFHDFDLTRLDPLSEYNGKLIHEWAMNHYHGRGIAHAVIDAASRVEAFIIHCEAGVSRSPSIAMAIADCMGWPRSCIDWITPEGDPPNKHVYDEMVLGFERLREEAVGQEQTR